MELWDAYYEDLTPANLDLVRSEPIPEGLFHAVAHVVVVHADGDHLVMRRDTQKSWYPGLYEAGASGGIVKGETFLEGALRELREETGICAHALDPLYTIISRAEQSLHIGYICRVNIDKSSITLQPGETIGYKWLPMDEFMELVNSNQFVDIVRDRMGEYLASLG